ncbi:MAG: class I SAM-dependent methyltransferase [Actinomycetota bacterium]
MVRTSRKHVLQPEWSRGSNRDRWIAVRPFVTGKTVLDLGCASGHRRPDWFHSLIRGVAHDVVGVDRDIEAVETLRERGNEIVVGDGEDLRLERRFDLVFAGELIEHLENFRGFLDGVRRHLEPGGLFVLTTPNVFGFSNFVYRLFKNAPLNAEHTCWFCEDSIRQLLERNGFEVLEIKFVPHSTPGRARRTVASLIRVILPERLAWNTLLVVARPGACGVRPRSGGL